MLYKSQKEALRRATKVPKRELRRRKERAAKKRDKVLSGYSKVKLNMTFGQCVSTLWFYNSYLRRCRVERVKPVLVDFARTRGISVKQLKKAIERVESVGEDRQFSTKLKNSRRTRGGGRTKQVLSKEVHTTLRNFVVFARGANPKTQVKKETKKESRLDAIFSSQTVAEVPLESDHAAALEEEDEEKLNLYCLKNGKRLNITYKDLVDRVLWNHKTEWATATPEAWYTRVRRWCKDQGLSYRKPNRTVLDPSRTARALAELKATLEKVEALRAAKTFTDISQLANLDETSMRMLSLQLKTLAWTGSPDVATSPHAGSKLALSMPVVWYGDGTMDFIVVWRSNRKSLAATQRWQNIKGVMWFEAKSKWSNTKTYHQILRYFLSVKRGIRVFFDDYAPGHTGHAPDLFLSSINCTRVRIPKNTTHLFQPAARPQTNYKLKNLVRNALRTERITKALRGEIMSKDSSLSMETKEHLSVILAEIRNQMNTDKATREGIVNSFKETVLSTQFAPSKQLREFLESAPFEEDPVGYAKQLEVEIGEHKCDDCGDNWKTKCKAYNNHAEVCYFKRGKLLAPLLEPSTDPTVVNRDHTPGLVANPADKSHQSVIFSEAGHFYLDTLEPAKPQWWKNKKLTYRLAEDAERDLLELHLSS